MVERKWHIRLGAAAELDFANILKWTTENFGARQSRVYRNIMVKAIGELADGPDVAGSKPRDEIIPGLRTLHVAWQGRRGGHFLMHRIAPNSTIENRTHPPQPNGPSAPGSIGAPVEIRTPDPQIRSQKTANRQVRASVAMRRPSHSFCLRLFSTL
jgi:toxin ParE1/3/4